MVLQQVMWCSSERERVVTRLVALISRWKQFLKRQVPRGNTIVHDRQEESMQATHAQVCTPWSSHFPIEEQETQTCKAVIPVTTMNETTPLIVVHNLEKTYQYGK